MFETQVIPGPTKRASRVSQALALLAILLSLPSVSPGPAHAAPAQSDCGERLRVPAGVDNPELDGSVPVVFVHGISSSAEMWNTDAADGGRNLAQTINDLDGTSVWAFDYGDASLEWVTDPRIGDALADSISCLYEQSGNRVILVAHSMGGLAIQYAVGQGGVEGAVAHISTIATPFEGSTSLTMVNRFLDPTVPGPLPASWRVAARLLRAACAGISRSGLWSICGPGGIPGSPVGTALMEGSEEIAALPPWSGAVPTFRVAGEMELPPLTTPVGDIAVGLESALAPRVVDSVAPTVIGCRATPATFLRARCYHSNLPQDRQVIDAIAAQVEPMVAREAGRLWVGSTDAVVSRSTHMVSAGYRMHGDFSFIVDDEGRIEGYARVEYEPFFDADGLNAALDYIETAGSEMVGLLTLMLPVRVRVDGSAIVELGLSGLQAVRGEYDRPVTIMEGPIAGELIDNGTPMLSIEWDGVEQIELPITVFIDGAAGSLEIGREAVATESPWPDSAPVEEQDGMRRAVSVTNVDETDGSVTVASNHSWSAFAAG